MKILPGSGEALTCFCSVLFLVSTIFLCHADALLDKTVEVVGQGVCADCAQTNVRTGRPFSGLHVAVHCKHVNGTFQARGVGALDRAGRFKVAIPASVVRDGTLAEECFAQLHSASSSPCPSLARPEFSKIIVETRTESGHRLGLSGGSLEFSRKTCASAFFWPFFKFPFWHKHFPWYPPYPVPTPMYPYASPPPPAYWNAPPPPYIYASPPPPPYNYASPPPPPPYIHKSPPPPPPYIHRTPPPPPIRRKPPPPPPIRRKPPPPPPVRRKPPPPPRRHHDTPPSHKRPPPPPRSPIIRRPPPPPTPRHAYPPPPPYMPPYKNPPPAPMYWNPPPSPYFPPYKNPPPAPMYWNPPSSPYFPPYMNPPPAPMYWNPPSSPFYPCIPLHWYNSKKFPFLKPCQPHPWFWNRPTFGNKFPFFPPIGSRP